MPALNMRSQKTDFQPKIVAFCCHWCSYAGSDLAGVLRLSYPAQVKIIRVPCSGRIDPIFVIKAFQNGADGVIVAGCHPGDCHYTSGNLFAQRRMLILRDFLRNQGIDPKRFTLTWISAAEAAKFVQVVTRAVEVNKALGPLHK